MAKYFDVSEFACKCCGGLPENGIDVRLQNVLDAMRERAGQPLILSCAYRCPTHNAEVGGVSNSQHLLGTGADVICPDNMTVDELADLAIKCGADGVGRYYNSYFVHVDTRGYKAYWTDRD